MKTIFLILGLLVVSSCGREPIADSERDDDHRRRDRDDRRDDDDRDNDHWWLP